MRKLQSYRNQLDKINNLLDKLENGSLTKPEVKELEELTRLIHEKSIILKYKVFANEEISAPIDSEPIIEEVITEPEIQEEEKQGEEMPMFDWSPSAEVEAIPEPIEEEIETPPSVSSIMETVIEEIRPEPVVEPISEPVVEEVSSQAEEVSETLNEVTSDSKGTFLDQLNISDSSLHTTMNDSKLDTLIGAFGLNEKLRYINDLFDGSSELFGNAVKTLDSQNDIDSANQKVNELAAEHSWDPEEETVAEFLSYVNRRYA